MRVDRYAVTCAAALVVALAVSTCGATAPPNLTPEGVGTHASQTATTPTSEPSGVAWSISPIDAAFSQVCFCTDYQVLVTVETIGATTDWHVTWTLQLEDIDPLPGRVDAGCDNNGVGTTAPKTATLSFVGTGKKQTASFTWYHPSPTDVPPGYSAGTFHCNHAFEGKRGHQGKILVVVTHGVLRCSAAYYGTHTGTGLELDQPGPPVCLKV